MYRCEVSKQGGVHTSDMSTDLKTKRNCARALLVLVLVCLRHLSSVLSCRVFFSHGVLLSSFHVHRCLFVSRAFELMSAQFL